MKKKTLQKAVSTLPISKAKFNTVFEKATPDLSEAGKLILEHAAKLEDSRFSATLKAITFSTEIAYGFMRANSRCVELNLFVPLDFDLGAKWKESRHTASKKLGTLRVIAKGDVNSVLKGIITEAHLLSTRPRKRNIETKDGFFATLNSLRRKDEVSEEK